MKKKINQKGNDIWYYYFKNNVGITIISLVITIIVLLIIVGVSLSFVTGSDGIIQKAEIARTKYEKSAEKEVLELAYSSLFMNYELFNEEITPDDLSKEIEENGKKAGVVEDEDDRTTMIVTFNETNNIYYLNMTSGKVEFVGTYEGTDKDIELKAGDINFDSTPTEWTNGSVLTTISVNSEIDMTNFVLQYSKDGKNWTVYTTAITSDKNEAIYARIKHNMTGQKKLEASTTIGNIDKVIPTGNLEIVTNTTSSVTLQVTANDGSGSGIKGYYYSKDDGTSYTELLTDTSYTFNGLTQTTNYDFKVKIEDNVGNITEVGVTGDTGTVETASGASIAPTTWTNGDVTVTLPTKVGYTTRYTIDGTIPTKDSTQYTSEFAVSSNCIINYCYSDGTNVGGYGSINVSNIDKIAPTISGASEITVGKNTIINETYIRSNNTISDNASSVAISDLQIKNSSNTIVGQTLDGYDIYSVSYNLKDEAGNSTPVTQSVTTKPDTSITLTNIVANSGFENGTDSWSVGNVNLVTSEKASGSYSMQFVLAANPTMLIQSISKPESYHTYYGSRMVKTVGGYSYAADYRFEMYYTDATDSNYVLAENYGDFPNWTRSSGIIKTGIPNGGDTWIIRSFQVNASGGTMYTDDYMIIDLTNAFGNDTPSKAWMDKMVTYFEGTKVFNW